VEHDNRVKSDDVFSESLGLYNPKYSLIKDNEGINYSGEKLIEEIEVDSVLDLKLGEQDICDPYEGK
jgi:hypothetical protein